MMYPTGNSRCRNPSTFSHCHMQLLTVSVCSDHTTQFPLAHHHITCSVTLQAPQSVAAAAAAPAGVPQLPARPAAATAAASAAAKRANAASLAATNSSAPSNGSAVNNGPAIQQAAGEIAEAAGLAMVDAGVPQTSGQTSVQNGKEPVRQSQAVNGNGLSGPQPGANGLPRALPNKAVPAASAKDVSVILSCGVQQA